MNRVKFIQLCLTSVGAVYFTQCKAEAISYKVLLINDNAEAGHLLRNPPTQYNITQTQHCDIAIIGGGVTALSAARWLSKNSSQTITIVELDDTLGGNAAAGKNNVSEYPWAAHYLPIPNNEDEYLIDFLTESKIITSTINNQPVYNEEYLCHDPKERLFIANRWQEGIIPNSGISKLEREQIKKFHAYIDSIKDNKGSDGKFIFDLPLHKCSTQNELVALDKITFKQWLIENGYNSNAMLWYANYACSDDYGANITQVSAWAGLHYYCARRGLGNNAKQHEVLTWPEGNYFLVKKLREQSKAIIKTNEVAFMVNEIGNQWHITHYNTKTKTYSKIICEKLICATPMRVANLLFPNIIPSEVLDNAAHFPWLNANIVLKEKFKNAVGQEQSWDNVIFNNKSLGYVVATHQNLTNTKKQNITFYNPLNTSDAKTMRSKIRNMNIEGYKKLIIDELKVAHPTIETLIESIEIKVLGHGMIAPTPNYVHHPKRKATYAHSKGTLILAHTDYCGISVFEEAFHCGIAAAKNIMANV